MCSTPADFKARFPEFDSVDDSRIQLFIDDATLVLNESYWGVKYDLGICYLTAHYLAIAERTSLGAGADGAYSSVASRAVDGTSISYSQPTIDRLGDSYYMSTVYGQRYIQLRDGLPIPAYSV